MYDKYKALEAQYAWSTYIQMLCTSAGCLRESKSQHGLENLNNTRVQSARQQHQQRKTNNKARTLNESKRNNEDRYRYPPSTTIIYVPYNLGGPKNAPRSLRWRLESRGFRRGVLQEDRKSHQGNRVFLSALDRTLYLGWKDIPLLGVLISS